MKCKDCTQFSYRDNSTTFSVFGGCSLMPDSNDFFGEEVETNKVYSWDGESYNSGCYVGPNFGCIHFVANVDK